MQLTIVLLCHNRPQLAKQAIESIVLQTRKDFIFIISDNSTNLDLHNITKEICPLVEYKSWYPGISAEAHFKEARKLVKTKYFVLFHDDDILNKEYVNNIINQFNINPCIAAIGTNGNFIDYSGNKINSKKIFRCDKKTEVIDNGVALINKYLIEGAGGAAPFSSYAYNSDLISDVFMDWSKGRAYFDTIFLSEIANKSKILWIDKPLVMVRDHDIRISTACGVRDYKAFINIIKNKYGKEIKKYNIEEYHLVHLFFEVVKRNKNSKPIYKYFLIKIPQLMIFSNSFRLRVIKYFVKRLMNKIKWE